MKHILYILLFIIVTTPSNAQEFCPNDLTEDQSKIVDKLIKEGVYTPIQIPLIPNTVRVKWHIVAS